MHNNIRGRRFAGFSLKAACACGQSYTSSNEIQLVQYVGVNCVIVRIQNVKLLFPELAVLFISVCIEIWPRKGERTIDARPRTRRVLIFHLFYFIFRSQLKMRHDAMAKSVA